ncbi:putative metalloprotease with PDZ domain [Polaromonas sp. CG_9.5]|uniref:M61 family metallopeptidase n=1 Tax=Polaromonas sp. CG_9.5 TaxID=3071705 RepID=UPI002E0168A7|nr:putative metalloprotease with PDZ domain [Polaromonas sp. CG_9.5]
MPASTISPLPKSSTTSTPKRADKRAAAPPAHHYRVEIGDLHAHLFQVTLTIARPAALQRVSLPVWIPGSYLVREFAKNLQGLQAQQGKGSAVVTQVEKSSWQIICTPTKPLVLRYQVHAHDNSVRTAWLDANRGFFNGTSVCLRVEGQEKSPHVLELPASRALAGWSVATGLTPQKINTRGFGSYQASDYDELVDCPVEMGAFWSGSFTARGVPHRFVVAGASASFDGARLLADTQKICEAEIRFWHGSKKPPHENYLFMLNAVDDGYGGLEHRNSTALICTRKDLPRLGDAKTSDGYTTLRGLISHEYFHTWNVKRLRPAEFENYQYDRENYTELLWFFEGFTSYYDDLMLRRAGLLDNAAYLKLLTTTLNQVQQAPGRLVQSVAEASFDAWVKFYRPDENTPNTTISYYAKGALIALCLDLTLRTEGRTTHGATLDDVMRALWRRCKGGPMREADVAKVLDTLGLRSFAPELASWVHGRDELPLKELLHLQGVNVLEEPAQMAQQLGLRVSESQGLHIKTVLRGGAAQQAGFAAGDEWLGLELPAKPSASRAAAATGGWRMSRLDDLALYAGSAKKVIALVARDKRLMRLELTLPPALTTWRLTVRDAARVNDWLDPQA